jgi:hypothetical protein
MEVSYVERETKDLFGIDYRQNVSGGSLAIFYEDKSFQDIKKLFNNITLENNYILAVSIQENYFKN